MFLFSLFSSISLIVYFPVFIYFSNSNCYIFLDKTRNTFQYIFGYLLVLLLILLVIFHILMIMEFQQLEIHLVLGVYRLIGEFI